MRTIADILDERTLFHADSSQSVRDVAKQMSDLHIGAIAVLSDGKLVGIFSERDVLTRVVAEGRDPDGTPVSTVMTKELIAADPSEDVQSALQKMQERQCRHLPVVDAGNLVGMISIRDLLQIEAGASKERARFLSELVTYSPDYDS
jgi:CBS domain-containing protein